VNNQFAEYTFDAAFDQVFKRFNNNSRYSKS